MVLASHWRRVLDADLSQLPTGPHGDPRDCHDVIGTKELSYLTGLSRQSVSAWMIRNQVPVLGRAGNTVRYDTAAVLHALRTNRGQGNHTVGTARAEAIAKRTAANAARRTRPSWG